MYIYTIKDNDEPATGDVKHYYENLVREHTK